MDTTICHGCGRLIKYDIGRKAKPHERAIAFCNNRCFHLFKNKYRGWENIHVFCANAQCPVDGNKEPRIAPCPTCGRTTKDDWRKGPKYPIVIQKTYCPECEMEIGRIGKYDINDKYVCMCENGCWLLTVNGWIWMEGMRPQDVVGE